MARERGEAVDALRPLGDRPSRVTALEREGGAATASGGATMELEIASPKRRR